MQYQPKTYIITSAQSFSEPNIPFLNSLEKFASFVNGELLILPMIGSSAKEDWNFKYMDSQLKRFPFVYDEMRLNNNVMIDQFYIRPWQIDPITGLSRFTQRAISTIFASPKQRLKYIPHSNIKIPKALITTGAITLPNYATSEDFSAERRRLGNLALRDHIYGAWIVEVIDDEIYHHRNVRALSNGKFVDLGTLFLPNEEPREATLEAIVFGDWHVGYTDPVVKEANLRMIKDFKPKRIVLHDFFDGHSVNHHKEGHLISQKIREGSDKGFLSLDEELKACYDELCYLLDALETNNNGREILVVYSNHDPMMLERYLDEGRFINDPLNLKKALELAKEFADGKNPVEMGIKSHGKLPKNVKFLRADEDYKILGYQLAAHGHFGPNGRRGNAKTIEADAGKSISGHTHQAEILRDTYVVGTSTYLVLPYAQGPNACTNTHALLWNVSNNGLVQLVNVINGFYSRADQKRASEN
ncbi:MAG: hypothetical protein QXE31_03790 [Candidatus Woesearchaeota archaeon]